MLEMLHRYYTDHELVVLCQDCDRKRRQAPLSVTVFHLAREVHFEPPRAWSVQARCAFVYHEGGPFAAEAGRLLHAGGEP